jgi:MFS family permease
VQTRLALFYCASALSGAFSGLLAFGIAKMDGVGGRPGWAWIFLLEGIVTVIIGAACFFIMPDTPALSGKWLTAEEMHYFAIQNMIKDGGRATSEHADKFKWSYLIDLVTDYKVYLQAWILFTASVCAYGKSHSTFSIDRDTNIFQASSSQCPQSPSQWATHQPKPSF